MGKIIQGITVDDFIKQLTELKEKGEIKGIDLMAMSRDSEGNGYSLMDESFWSTGYLPKEWGRHELITEQDFNDANEEDENDGSFEDFLRDNIDEQATKYESFEEYLKDNYEGHVPVVVLWGCN